MKLHLLILLLSITLIFVQCQSSDDYDMGGPEFDDLSKIDLGYIDNYDAPVRFKNSQPQFYQQLEKRETSENQEVVPEQDQVKEQKDKSLSMKNGQNDKIKQQRIVREDSASNKPQSKAEKDSKPPQSSINPENQAINSPTNNEIDEGNEQTQVKPIRQAPQSSDVQKPQSNPQETVNVNKREEKPAKPLDQDVSQSDEKPLQQQKRNYRRSNMQQYMVQPVVQPRQLSRNSTVPCMEGGNRMGMAAGMDHPNTNDFSNGMDRSNVVVPMIPGQVPVFEGPPQQTVSQLACSGPSAMQQPPPDNQCSQDVDPAPIRELKLNILRLESRLEAETKQETALFRASKEADAMATEIGRKIGVLKLKLRWATDGARVDQARVQELQTRGEALAKAVAVARQKLEATEQQNMGSCLRRRRFPEISTANASDGRRQEQEKALFDATEDLEHLQVALDASKSYLDDAMTVVAALSASLGELQAQATGAYQRDAELRMARRRQSDVTHQLAAQLSEAQARRMQALAASLAQARGKRRRRQLEKKLLELSRKNPGTYNKAAKNDGNLLRARLTKRGIMNGVGRNVRLYRRDLGRQEQLKPGVAKSLDGLQKDKDSLSSKRKQNLEVSRLGEVNQGNDLLESAKAELADKEREFSVIEKSNSEKRDKRDRWTNLKMDEDSEGNGLSERGYKTNFDSYFDFGHPRSSARSQLREGDGKYSSDVSQLKKDAPTNLENLWGNHENPSLSKDEEYLQGMNSRLGRDRLETERDSPGRLDRGFRMVYRDASGLYEPSRERTDQESLQDGIVTSQDASDLNLVNPEIDDSAFAVEPAPFSNDKRFSLGQSDSKLDDTQPLHSNEYDLRDIEAQYAQLTKEIDAYRSEVLQKSPLDGNRQRTQDGSSEIAEENLGENRNDLLQSQQRDLSLPEFSAYRPRRFRRSPQGTEEKQQPAKEVAEEMTLSDEDALPVPEKSDLEKFSGLQEYQHGFSDLDLDTDLVADSVGCPTCASQESEVPAQCPTCAAQGSEVAVQCPTCAAQGPEVAAQCPTAAAQETEVAAQCPTAAAHELKIAAQCPTAAPQELQVAALCPTAVPRELEVAAQCPTGVPRELEVAAQCPTAAEPETEVAVECPTPAAPELARGVQELVGAAQVSAGAEQVLEPQMQGRPRLVRQAVPMATQQTRPASPLVRSDSGPGTGCPGTGSGSSSDREQRLTCELQKVTQQRAVEEARVNHERSEVHRAQLIARGALFRLRAALLSTTQLRTDVCAVRAEAESAARAARCAQAKLAKAEAARARATCAVDELNQKLADVAANESFACPPGKDNHQGEAKGESCTAEQQFKAIMQKIYLAEANVKVQNVEVSAARRALILQRSRLERVLDQLAALKAETRAQHKTTAAAACASREAQASLGCHNRRLDREQSDLAALTDLETDLQKALAEVR